MQIPQPASVPPPNERAVIQPYVMSHGTLEVADLAVSRRFYEDFLGLECVRHARSAMAVRCGLRFHVICVQVGERLNPMGLLNHWGLDVGSRESVDAAYTATLAMKDAYGIRAVTERQSQHGVYAFYLQDIDHNWWEIQHYEGFQHDDIFDFGDRFPE
ncbi:MAG: VOC family protein [Variovorax sp.]|jgi:catechol 2,3-dioxygenase-like lactoylglutathione lyase family enzyme|uniref:VOC family protein n=1 Tax=Variovorax sp. TaxID=1871043 RepID=UPI00121576B3|nr:MAG: VOC family protein [Variovorax sp.]